MFSQPLWVEPVPSVLSDACPLLSVSQARPLSEKLSAILLSLNNKVRLLGFVPALGDSCCWRRRPELKNFGWHGLAPICEAGWAEDFEALKTLNLTWHERMFIKCNTLPRALQLWVIQNLYWLDLSFVVLRVSTQVGKGRIPSLLLPWMQFRHHLFQGIWFRLKHQQNYCHKLY